MSFEGEPSILPGAHLGHYLIVRMIGRGGMGTVYEALDERMDKRVALKTLRRASANAEGKQRFMREAQAAARVRHPNVVDVYDVGIGDGLPYLAMELLEGENLSILLARERRISVPRLVAILIPVASALAAAHAEGIVHRDLKPENIFLARTRAGTEVVKLLDFGISRFEDPVDGAQLTRSNALLGTPFYMSPEQALGRRQLDGRSDQYSFGLVAFQALTGSLPVEGEALLPVLQRIAYEPVPAISSLQPDVPQVFSNVVGRCLAKEPSLRFPTMGDVLNELLAFADERTRETWAHAASRAMTPTPNRVTSITPTRVATSVPVTRLASRASPERSVPWLLVAVAVLVAAGVGWVLWPAEAPPSLVPSASYVVEVTATPTTARLSLDDGLEGRGSLVARLPVDGRAHDLRVVAEGYEPVTVTFRDAPPPRSVVLVALPSDAGVEAVPDVRVRARSSVVARPNGAPAEQPLEANPEEPPPPSVPPVEVPHVGAEPVEVPASPARPDAGRRPLNNAVIVR